MMDDDLESRAEEARIAFLENAELEVQVESEIRDRDEAEECLRLVERNVRDSEHDLKRAEDELREAEIAYRQSTGYLLPQNNEVSNDFYTDETYSISTSAQIQASSNDDIALGGGERPSWRGSILETMAEIDVMRRDSADRALRAALRRNAFIEIDSSRFDMTNCCSSELRRALTQAKRAASTRRLVRISELVADAREALTHEPPQWHAIKSSNVLRAAIQDFAESNNNRDSFSLDLLPGAEELEASAAALDTRKAVESIFAAVVNDNNQSSLSTYLKQYSLQLCRAPRTAHLIKVIKAYQDLHHINSFQDKNNTYGKEEAREQARIKLDTALSQLDHFLEPAKSLTQQASTLLPRKFVDILHTPSALAAFQIIRSALFNSTTS